MSLNRRNFVKSIGALGVFTTIKPNDIISQKVQNSDFSFTALPYLQNFQPNKITIVATFSKSCIAWLEVINDDNSISQTHYQTEDGMRNANTDLFKFTIPHDNSNFKYRIVAKEILKFEAYKIEYGKTIQTDIIATQMPLKKEDNINILILNDIHEDTSSYIDLYNKSNLASKDLVVLNGDCFHHVNTKDDIINKLSKPVAQTFGSTTPFILVRGNHETRGPYAREIKKHFDFPNNKYYQSILLGSIFIVTLDAGEDKPDTHEVYGGTIDYDSYRREQKKWLEKELKSKERKKAKHTIIITHIPWLYSDDWHGTKDNYDCFHEITHKYKVDAVISGHTHEYAFHPATKDHNYCVIIGGGPKAGDRTFVELTTNKNQLTINLKKDDGSLINSYQK